MQAQLVALLSCNKKVVGLTPGQGSFCMEFACSLHGYSGFLPQSKNMTVRLIGFSKLPLGVHECVCVVCPVCVCVALRSTGDLSSVYPASCRWTAGDRHQLPFFPLWKW
ncbi:hypothetical protein ILYODFUR_038858 [Ilyodon furcidens]|uniref:Uncharacterized protein n=1 Tax=Ilyodon furcidens TaxID=33524 RepID=A0ABV0VM78_9TELE